MLETVGNLYVRAKIQWLQKLRKQALECQQNEFKHLIQEHKNTAYLKPFNLSGSYSNFAQKVPIATYETLKPFIQRTMLGEQNVLCSDPIWHFAKSSGTTDVSKFIPVSSAAMFKGHFLASRHLLASYFERFPNNRIFSGKHLVISGSVQAIAGSKKAICGDVSALLTKQIPAWIQKLRTPDLHTALLANWDEKLQAIAQQTFQQNVTGMSGVPSWSLELLKAIVHTAHKKNIADVWPHFELYIHGGVNFEPYQAAFERILGKQVNYVNAYNASEGFFGFSDTASTRELLLLPAHGIFFEFRAVSNPNIIVPLEGVEKETVYELVISTNSGLWRYALGDTISFTSLQPYRFVIEGRTKQYINIAGEELMVHNAETALATVCKMLDCQVHEFSAAPLFFEDGTACHQWLIEFEKLSVSIETFESLLDSELQKINSDYHAKRNGNFVLKPLQTILLPQGFFRNWLNEKKKLGAQFKVPRLSNSRQYANDILQFNQTHN